MPKTDWYSVPHICRAEVHMVDWGGPAQGRWFVGIGKDTTGKALHSVGPDMEMRSQAQYLANVINEMLIIIWAHEYNKEDEIYGDWEAMKKADKKMNKRDRRK